MKRKNFLRFFCILLGIITLLSAVPVFAENETSAQLLDIAIDFEIGEEKTVISGTRMQEDGVTLDATNVSAALNADIRTPADYAEQSNNCGIYADLKDGTNYALKIASSSSYFAVKDADKKLVGTDFTVSADFYLTLDSFTEGKSVRLIQWITNAELAENDGTVSNKYEFIRVAKDGSLCLGSKDLGVDVADQTWFNITADVKYVSENNYSISLYLNKTPVYTFTQTVTVPTDGGSYIVFYTRNNCGCRESYLDNVRIYQSASEPSIEVPADDRLYTMLTFDGWASTPTGDIRGIGTTNNISSYVNTDKTAVTFPLDYSYTQGGRIATVSTESNSNNKVFHNTSSMTFVAVEDIEGRLEKNDFTVSADMYLASIITTNKELSLLQWTKGTGLASADSITRYSFVSVNKNGELVAGGNSIGITVETSTWFNITAKVKYLSGDSYEISLYLNDDFIFVYTQDMPMPTGATKSYIRFWDNNSSSYKGSYLDNLCIYEEFDKRDILDTTITFDDWGSGFTGRNVRGDESAGELYYIGSYVNTDKTAITFPLDHGINLRSRIAENTNDSKGYSFHIDASGNRTFLAIEDIGRRLEKNNFTVSADMYLVNTSLSNPYPLLQWSKGTGLKDNTNEIKYHTDYYFVRVRPNGNDTTKGNLVVNNETLDTSVNFNEWFNITVEVKYLYGDTYNVAVYLNKIYICDYNAEMPVPEGATKSYIRFWDNINAGSIAGSYMDNLHISEKLPIALELDFNGDYTLGLNRIGKDNYFPAIGDGAEVLTEGENSYLRINHSELAADQKGYIAADSEKFIGFDQYLIEADFRYSGSAKFNASVATIVADSYTKTFTPVGIKGNNNKLYASIGGSQYDLYTKDGKFIKASATDDTDFTKVAILVDDGSLTYTVYVNGQVAYYYAGRKLTPCVSLPITFEDSGLFAAVNPQLRLLEINASKDNDCALDISRLAVKSLLSGISSEVKGTQTKSVLDDNTYGVRFVSAIDTLYGNAVGFEITAVYTDSDGEQTKEYDKSSNIVFEKIEADGEYIYAYELNCGYLAAIQIVDIPMETAVTFTAKPYVNHGGIKVYGEAITQTFDFTENIVEPMLSLDFNTGLSLADYIASVDGVEVHESYKDGEIVDGKWKYSGGPLVLKDNCGIFDTKSYSLEFDVCFNSFLNREDSPVFSFMTDDDGTLDASTASFSLRIDKNGNMYLQNLKSSAIQLEEGQRYNIRFDVDRENTCISTYVNGSPWTLPINYGQKNNEYNCFRFMYPSTNEDVWFDNFRVIDTSYQKNPPISIVAVDVATIRSGKYADTVRALDDDCIWIRYTASADNYREGLIKFDISSLKADYIGYTKFTGTYINLSNERTFDIYWVDSDWSGTTVTFNTAPTGKLIAQNITFGGKGAPLELAPYIKEALENGDEYFSIKIVPTYQSDTSVTKIKFSEQSKPTVSVFNDKSDKSYFEKLVEDEDTNKSIWDYAQQMYDEWYAKYQAFEVNSKAEMLSPDESQYIRSSYASKSSSDFASKKKEYASRPLEGITDLDEYVTTEFKNAKFDEYGGIMVETLKQKATGYFYTTKINNRWFIIDPLGYPYINIGLSAIHYSLNGSTTQAQNTLDKYGTYENWASETTKHVRDDFYFNSTFAQAEEITNVENGLPYIKPAYAIMANFALVKGGTIKAIENNVMPVFDPDFVDYANYNVKEAVTGYASDSRIIGFTFDNELPVDLVMLDNALSVNHMKPVNHYTYACAWTWLVNMTGKESPTYDDITDELRDLFRGFVYDRYFNVVSTALGSAAPNHMYMGCKFLPYVKDSKWIFAFASQYVDVLTVNWYFCWEPETDVIYNIEKYGDLPFIVTEFYATAGDSGLGNTSGAGWYVETQKDRADFYDTFVIKLLESNNGVGWQWFHYMDNDPDSGTSDSTSVDSNKGICRSDLTYYTDLTDRMTILNNNVYNIIDYFANKKNAD